MSASRGPLGESLAEPCAHGSEDGAVLHLETSGTFSTPREGMAQTHNLMTFGRAAASRYDRDNNEEEVLLRQESSDLNMDEDEPFGTPAHCTETGIRDKRRSSSRNSTRTGMDDRSQQAEISAAPQAMERDDHLDITPSPRPQPSIAPALSAKSRRGPLPLQVSRVISDEHLDAADYDIAAVATELGFSELSVPQLSSPAAPPHTHASSPRKGHVHAAAHTHGAAHSAAHTHTPGAHGAGAVAAPFHLGARSNSRITGGSPLVSPGGLLSPPGARAVRVSPWSTAGSPTGAASTSPTAMPSRVSFETPVWHGPRTTGSTSVSPRPEPLMHSHSRLSRSSLDARVADTSRRPIPPRVADADAMSEGRSEGDEPLDLDDLERELGITPTRGRGTRA